MKTLYLHIGTHKTGTSALQDFLFKNSSTLKSHGIHYPTWFRTSAHHFFTLGINGLNTENLPQEKSLQKKISQLNALCLEGDGKVIISSEGFALFTKEQIDYLKKSIHGLEVKIIVYLRRQDEYLESSYNQIAKTRKASTFSDHLTNLENTHRLDYTHLLSSWSDAFGESNLILRIYDKTQFNKNNIYSDFFAALDEDITALFSEIPQSVYNRSLDMRTIAMIQKLECYNHTNKEKIITAIESYWLHHPIDKGGKLSYLSNDQRLAIIKKSQPSNQQILSSNKFNCPAPIGRSSLFAEPNFNNYIHFTEVNDYHSRRIYNLLKPLL